MKPTRAFAVLCRESFDEGDGCRRTTTDVVARFETQAEADAYCTREDAKGGDCAFLVREMPMTPAERERASELARDAFCRRMEQAAERIYG